MRFFNPNVIISGESAYDVHFINEFLFINFLIICILLLSLYLFKRYSKSIINSLPQKEESLDKKSKGGKGGNDASEESRLHSEA